jgi:hypothetical protein
VVIFEDEYEIQVAGGDLFVKVWCRPTSTRYESVDVLPPDFRTQFTPIR